MAESESLFQKVDTFIFRKVTLLREQAFIIKLQDKIAELDDTTRTILSYTGSIALILLPLIVLFIFFASNRSLYRNYQIKKETLQIAQEVIQNQTGLEQQAHRLFPPAAIANENSFKEKITNSATMAKIDSANINATDFSNKKDSTLNISEMKVSFFGLDIDQFTEFMATLTDGQHFHIVAAEVKKSVETKLLEGFFQLSYYAKEATP